MIAIARLYIIASSKQQGCIHKTNSKAINLASNCEHRKIARLYLIFNSMYAVYINK
jgi:hypothetical protein